MTHDPAADPRPERGGAYDWAVLVVSSRDRSGDDDWVGIGSGSWDSAGRASFVNPDRMLAVSGSAVRREGAAMTKEQHRTVLAAITGR